MADFDEKDVVETLPAGQDFAPEDVHEDITPGIPKEDITKLESALEGAKQGATLGFADELAGATGAGLDATQALLNKLGLVSKSPTQVNEELAQKGFKGDLGPQNLVEAYRQARDQDRARMQAAQKQNPISFGAGAVAGGLATAPLMPAGPIVGGGLKAAAPIVAGAAGLSEADLTKGDLGKAAAQTIEGTALGASIPVAGLAAQAALKGTGKVAGKIIPESVKDDFAKGLQGIKTSGQEFYNDVTNRLKSVVDDVADPILKKSAQQQAENQTIISQADDALNAIKAQTDYSNKLSTAQQQAANKAEADALNHETVKVAENLQNQVMTVRKELGKNYDNIDEAAAAAGITPENRDVLSGLLEQLQQQPITEAQYNSVVKKLQPYLGNQNMDAFRGLKKELNDLAGSFEYPQAKLFRNAYSQLRNNYTNALVQGGRPDLAQQMSETNKRWSAATQLEDQFLSNLRPNYVTGKMEASPDTIRAVQQFGEKNPTQIAQAESLKNLLNTLQPKVAGKPSPAAGIVQDMSQLAEAQAANKGASPLQLPQGVNPEVERLQGILAQAKAANPSKIQGLDVSTQPEALTNELSTLLPKQGMRTGEDVAEKKLQQVMDFLGPEKSQKLQDTLGTLNKDIRLRNLKSRPEGQEVPTGLTAVANKALGGAGNITNAAGRTIKTSQDFLQKGIRSLSTATPETLKQVSQELSAKGPEGAMYGKILEEAAGKNSVSRNAIIFGLMQKPEFRKMFHGEDGDEQK